MDIYIINIKYSYSIFRLRAFNIYGFKDKTLHVNEFNTVNDTEKINNLVSYKF